MAPDAASEAPLRRAPVVAALAVLIVLLASPHEAAARASAGALRGDVCQLGAALAAPSLRGARIGALVVRARDGALVFARDADRSFAPASNQKILTALGALTRFGPSHRFVTDVLADAAPDAAGAVDTLYLRGSGDPGLVSEQWWRLAADLRLAGLRRVGRIVADDGAFDRERWHPSWTPVGARAYEAPIGALQANYGAFLVVVRPGRSPGAPVEVTIDPPVRALGLVVRAVTGGLSVPAGLGVARERGPAGDTVIVTGFLPEDAGEQRVSRSVADPTAYAVSVFAASLAANGIALDDPTLAVAEAPPGALRLLAFQGPELASSVRLLLQYSSNPIAEGLLKAMGGAETGEPGSFANGARALRATLAALGLDLAGAEIVDGSGLSLRDRVSPRTLVAALRIARGSFAIGPELLSGLPVAGRNGTLAHRAPDASERVRAKTGTLSGVVALSGFADAADGEELVFALLVNGARSNAVAGVDAFASALVSCAGVGPAE